MSVALATYKDSLTRTVVPMGSSLPSSVTSTVLTQYLVDAFWEARLDGLLEGYTCDVSGSITPLEGTEDLDRKWVSLIVLYAAIKILSNQILNTKSLRAKAGPVEFEQTISATVLAEMLKQLRLTKNQILEELDSLVGQTDTFIFDAYSIRALSPVGYWPSVELT